MGGPAHPFWKGDEVSYVNLHEWVRRHKEKKGVCEYCGREGKTHFANRSGLYHRDLTDYRELCSSCHKKFDGTT